MQNSMITNKEKREEKCNLFDVVWRQFSSDPMVIEAGVKYLRLHCGVLGSLLRSCHEMGEQMANSD